MFHKSRSRRGAWQPSHPLDLVLTTSEFFFCIFFGFFFIFAQLFACAQFTFTFAKAETEDETEDKKKGGWILSVAGN